jgi:histidine decarboxylase
MVKKSYKDRIGRSINYIGALDTTITGSRSGFNALALWYVIQKWGKEGIHIKAKQCIEHAIFLKDELNKIGVKAWTNENSFTVVFPRATDAICKKWQLASDNEVSHVICMPGVTKQMLEEFIYDMKNAQS